MTFGYNARQVEAMVRKELGDGVQQFFQRADVLERIDLALRPFLTDVIALGEDVDLWQHTAPIASMTMIDGLTWQYEVPSYVRSLELVEGNIGEGRVPLPINHRDLSDRHVGRYAGGGGPTYAWISGARSGTLEFNGRMDRFTSVTFHFIRRFAPISYGTLAAGAATTATLPAAADAGLTPPVDGLYAGLDVELTNNSPNGVQGLIGRVASSAGRVLTMEGAWATTPDNTTQYAILLPLDPEVVKHFAMQVAYDMLITSGQLTQLRAMEGRLMQLAEATLTHYTSRTAGGRPKLRSNRRI